MLTPAEIIAELRRQAALRNATWPCILLSEMMPLCDQFERIEAENKSMRMALYGASTIAYSLHPDDINADADSLYEEYYCQCDEIPTEQELDLAKCSACGKQLI